MVFHSKTNFFAGAITLLWHCAALAQTPIPMADFKSGPGNGLYSYASSTPATVLDKQQAFLGRRFLHVDL